MAAIRQFIRNNRQFQKQKQSFTSRHRVNYSLPVPQRQSKYLHKSSEGKAITSQLLLPKKTSLQPIVQAPSKSKPFSLQLKRRQAINDYFSSKNQSVISKKRIKTTGSQYNVNHINSRSRIVPNFDQIRMRPVDKYFYNMENLRLAERLLVVKPSPELTRKSQKKFYIEQQIYSSQISRNPRNIKNKKQKKTAKFESQKLEY